MGESEEGPQSELVSSGRVEVCAAICEYSKVLLFQSVTHF